MPGPATLPVPPSDADTNRARLLVVVPTYQEAENIHALVAAIETARVSVAFDVLIVDDSSPDGTAALAEALGRERPWLHLLVRPAPDGLGSAYREGFRWALARGYERVGEMDADLSHDPATVPALLAAVDAGAALAIGSRYVLGGATEGWPLARRMLSRGANLFARTLLALPARDVTAGFRVYDREAAQLVAQTGTRCNGYGFQVEAAYEVARTGGRLAEVPITFREREHGVSKMSAATAREAAARCFKLAFADATARREESRHLRLLLFLLVGGSGLAVNQLGLWYFTERVGWHYLLSAIVATQLSTLWNFAGTERVVFDAAREGRVARLFAFAALNNGWLLLRAPLLVLLTSVLGIHYLVSNLVLLIASSIGRFAISDSWIWSRAPRRRRRFHYDVHGVVRLASPTRLPELAPFAVEGFDEQPDIEILVRSRGFGGLRRRPGVALGETVAYVEQLGGLGFAMRVEQGERTRVTVSHLVSWSPHVLYTNVIEPLMRWQFVRAGTILAHAACLEVDGVGMLITARTDTGKTTTCLKSMRSHGSRFLSDDMVIVDERGGARAYPKPLTISAHTMAAARSAPLSRTRRALLEVQSRVHSKGGRAVGLRLADWQLPVATLNAVTQLLVPPPKFFVDQLIPGAASCETTTIQRLLVIERGEELQEVLDHETACAVLAENTEDAYGFPPYPLIGHALANGERSKEAIIRASALNGVSAMRLRTPDRDWYRRLPGYAHPMPSQPRLIILPEEVGFPVAISDAGSDAVPATALPA